MPETEMPLATQGVSRSPRFRIAIVEANDGGVVQLIDNPGHWATQQWVLNQFTVNAGVTEQWVVDNVTPALAQLLRAAALGVSYGVGTGAKAARELIVSN